MSSDPTPNATPPVISESPPAVPPLMANAGPAAVVETLLKRPLAIISRARLSGSHRLLLWLSLVIVVCAATYGAVVGTFTGGQQLWLAAIKVTIAMVGSALFCLPGLYIAACLNGRDVKLTEIASYLLAAVALTALLLVGFAPAVWLFSVSTNSIVFMGVLHLFVWSAGMLAGLRLLNLALGNGHVGIHGHVLLWCLMFVLVCLQMTTTLQPILGASEQFLPKEKKFFIAHWRDCARQ